MAIKVWKIECTTKRGDFEEIFHQIHKYLHNDELNFRFLMGINKYHVRATHVLYTYTQL